MRWNLEPPRASSSLLASNHPLPRRLKPPCASYSRESSPRCRRTCCLIFHIMRENRNVSPLQSPSYVLFTQSSTPPEVSDKLVRLNAFEITSVQLVCTKSTSYSTVQASSTQHTRVQRPEVSRKAGPADLIPNSKNATPHSKQCRRAPDIPN